MKWGEDDNYAAIVDGSFQRHAIHDLSRAAWAVSIYDLDSEMLIFSVAGPVWATLPQTSQSSEHVACAAVSQVARLHERRANQQLIP